MKIRTSLVRVLSGAGLCVFAYGSEITTDAKKVVIDPAPSDPLIVLDLKSSYVAESDFERGDGSRGDAFAINFRFGYRIPVSGPLWGGYEGSHWYLRVGAEYGRFDFDNEGGLPIPNTLQAFSGIIALEYLVKGRTAILVETQPGAYFEHDINSGTFDVPTKAVGVIRLTNSLFGVVGARYSALSNYPVVPVAGVHWLINDQWTLSLIPPDPRLIYAPSKGVEYWVGGELVGGSFKTDNRQVERKQKLSGAVVTYTDYRAGAGVTLSGDRWLLEFAGGYSFQRKFDYYRAEEGYKTDEGAPYATVAMRLSF